MTTPRVTSKRSADSRRSRLALLGQTAPLVAQLIMLVVTLATGQWLFAAMVAPGLLTYIASVYASVQRQRLDDQQTRQSRHPAGATDKPGTVSSAPRIDSPALETLLELDLNGAMNWRCIVHNWLGRHTQAVFIGMNDSGRFALDLKGQGPHALVAGTTGSGKSVLLQSWCLALALSNPPDKLNFIFMDFKGGSAFDCLDPLPHTVGSVCDLNLKLAVRALRSLEVELKRREQLVARHGVADVRELDDPPAQLVVVVDEFHALRSQLPDYVDRLVRIASLGRSLDMHIIVCTQNPIGQVSAEMKANMTLNICLRVRDAMQSNELLGSPQAAMISPQFPGTAYCHDGEALTAFRCAPAHNIDALINDIELANRFCGYTPRPRMFTQPLPPILRRLSDRDVTIDGPNATNVPFGLGDDGVAVYKACLPIAQGNVAVIGQFGRGKSTLLRTIAKRLHRIDTLSVRITTKRASTFVTRTRHGASCTPIEAGAASRTHAKHLVWLFDDADAPFDPFDSSQLATELRHALNDQETTVIFAVETTRHVRSGEHCAVRVVFPSGEREVDLMNGIPGTLITSFDHADLSTPGRAVLISRGSALPVQCLILTESEKNENP